MREQIGDKKVLLALSEGVIAALLIKVVGKQEGIEFLAQGTIYSDIVESGSEKAPPNVDGLPDFKSVGVRDDKHFFDWPVIIRAVNTRDAMTATVEDRPFALLQHITARITAEVAGVNRVLYDLTPKPTGTIECHMK